MSCRVALLVKCTYYSSSHWLPPGEEKLYINWCGPTGYLSPPLSILLILPPCPPPSVVLFYKIYTVKNNFLNLVRNLNHKSSLNFLSLIFQHWESGSWNTSLFVSCECCQYKNPQNWSTSLQVCFACNTFGKETRIPTHESCHNLFFLYKERVGTIIRAFLHFWDLPAATSDD